MQIDNIVGQISTVLVRTGVRPMVDFKVGTDLLDEAREAGAVPIKQEESCLNNPS